MYSRVVDIKVWPFMSHEPRIILILIIIIYIFSISSVYILHIFLSFCRLIALRANVVCCFNPTWNKAYLILSYLSYNDRHCVSNHPQLDGSKGCSGIKEIIKSTVAALCEGSPLVDSAHIGPVTGEAFLWHDIIMRNLLWNNNSSYIIYTYHGEALRKLLCEARSGYSPHCCFSEANKTGRVHWWICNEY